MLRMVIGYSDVNHVATLFRETDRTNYMSREVLNAYRRITANVVQISHSIDTVYVSMPTVTRLAKSRHITHIMAMNSFCR